MPTYSVQIPVTGSIIVTVEASDKNAAVEAAWEKADFRVVCDDHDCCPGDFDSHKHVTRGNVCYATCRDINVEEVD